jgi:predicted esterase
MKNNLLKICCITALLSSTSLFASNLVTQKQCEEKDSEEYIYAGGECIQYYLSEGEKEDELTILVPGTWPEGTNTLGRYGPFADNLSMITNITTIAVALPGYSNSSTNNFNALSHDEKTYLAGQKKYISFLSELMKKLKLQYEAKKLNYIGHSAGAMMGSTLTGFSPGLIDTLTSAGGSYDIHEKVKNRDDLISLVDYIDKVDKKTNFLLIYGTNDKISPPKVTKDFHKALEKQGLNSTLVEVKNAPHLDLDMKDASVEAIINMLDKE